MCATIIQISASNTVYYDTGTFEMYKIFSISYIVFGLSEKKLLTLSVVEGGDLDLDAIRLMSIRVYLHTYIDVYLHQTQFIEF